MSCPHVVPKDGHREDYYGWVITGDCPYISQNKMIHDHTKRRCRSIRLKGYDYSQKGAYFVTICTQNKKCILGGVEKGGMVLNEIGQMVQKAWTELPTHYTGIDIDEFVVMPNHLHGIIVLNDHCRGGAVRPLRAAPPYYMGEETSPLRKHTLGQIIAYFKYRTTKSINQIFNALGNRV